jgi:HAD superfamily hydrolase (TIGR01509 family)
MSSVPHIIWRGRKLEAVIFDLDGTLTDSVEVYYEAFKEASVHIGISLTREDIFEPLAEGSDAWQRAFPDGLSNSEEKVREFRRVMQPIFLEALRRVRPLPGVKELLSTLAQRKMKLGMVTDSSTISLQPLHDHTLIGYFHAIVTRDDGLPRKPKPDGVLECLRRMDVNPANAVLVGDTLLDVWAGKEAGTLTMGVLSGLASRSQFEKDPPTALVEDVTLIPRVLNLC